MSDIVKILPYSIDLNETIKKTDLHTLFVMGDKQAHRFELTISQGGTQASLDGCTVTGYFINHKSGTSVKIDGVNKDKKAAVTLSKPCYALHGQFTLIIQIVKDEVETSLFCGEGFMRSSTTETIIYDDYVIYDVSTLLAQISAMKTATKEANEATEAIKAQTEAAKKATDDANEAAEGADGWARATISAELLAAGSMPTAGVSTAEDGRKIITLGIPKGDTGLTPQITFEVATGEPGTEVQVSVSGTAEAPHLLLTIPRGNTGSIENLSINGKPVESGNITLKAADIGARPDDWMPSASDVGALPSNGTAVDASKLGGKAPEYYIQPRNLLDNSDFKNPVNQRGAASVSGAGLGNYNFIDRWSTYGAGSTFAIADGGIEIVNDGSATCGIAQRLESGAIQAGKRYTLACKATVTGTVYLSYGVTGDANTESSSALTTDTEMVHTFTFTAGESTDGLYNFRIRSTAAAATIHVEWMALYEGEYTADTLPPYVPKGYAAELAECLRYFWKAGNVGGTGYAYSSAVAYVLLTTPAYMRITPTIHAEDLELTVRSENKKYTFASFGSTIVKNDNQLRISISVADSGLVANQVMTMLKTAGTLEFSADL